MIIIVTAYDQHAIRAFEAGAVDYLLSPSVEPGSFKRWNGPGSSPATGCKWRSP